MAAIAWILTGLLTVWIIYHTERVLHREANMEHEFYRDFNDSIPGLVLLCVFGLVALMVVLASYWSRGVRIRLWS